MNINILRFAGGFILALLLFPVSLFFGISLLKSTILSVGVAVVFFIFSQLMIKVIGNKDSHRRGGVEEGEKKT